MASKIDVTLKRYNGATVDELYPTTHIGQIYTDNTETTLLSTYLDNTFINVDQLGVANGVATLDSNAKLLESQLPTYLFGGMEFEGNVALENGKTVDNIMATVVNPDPAQPNKLYAVGQYLQVSTTGVLDQGVTWTGTVLPPGDEGDYTFPITLEAGDWIVVNAIDFDAEAQTPAPTVTFAIVNNTYEFASTTQRGIVRLSDAANALNYDESTNPTGIVTSSGDVVTEGFLATNIVGGQLNNASAAGAAIENDKIARTDHLHDGRYYTEDEVEAFFDGSTPITGYNNTDWNDAFDSTIRSAAFVGDADTNNGVLTLTREDDTTLTVNLQNDFRYYTKTLINGWIDGSNTINGDTYTPIEYGANPTSTTTGAILIQTD